MQTNRVLFKIALTVLLACLLTLTGVAQTQIIGQVLTTDIRAYINDCEIPSYNINGKLAVVVTDLNHYGFTTSYNNDKRLSSVSVDPYVKTLTGLATTTSTLPVGTPVMDVYATDITVELDGVQVESFNIGGKMAIYFKDLQTFGTYRYDNASRSSRLTISDGKKARVPLTATATGGDDISIHNWAWYEADNLYLDYETHRTDEYSYCISDTKPNDLRIQRKYIVNPDTLYIVSADVKTKDVVNTENAVNPLGATISADNYNNSASVLGTNDWQTIQVLCRSDSQGELTVSMNLGYYSNTCTGTAWFENIRLTPLTEYGENAPTWKFLAVILTDTGINVMDSDTDRRIKLSHELSKAEIQAIRNSLQMFETDFTKDADGLFQVDVDIVEADAKCTSYTKDGNGYSISAGAAYTYLQENQIDITGYDHVIMITCLPSLPTNYYGLGGTYIDEKIGFSFVMHTDVQYCLDYLNGKYENLWPAAVYIHEFLHSIETYSTQLGFEIPVLHDAEKYGYTDHEEWRAWYQDFIHKTISHSGDKIGVDPQVWRLRPSMLP